MIKLGQSRVECIRIGPHPGTNITAIAQEAVALAATEKLDVEFLFNGLPYVVSYEELVGCVVEKRPQ